MNPVTGYTMLNFLEWLVLHHPEIQKLKNLSEIKLIDLVNEFESGKLDDNDNLRRKWVIGFDYLFNDEGDWEGYGRARRKFLNHEKSQFYTDSENISDENLVDQHWINLEILQNDLELILGNNFRILIAVDSIDILKLCFPNLDDNEIMYYDQDEFIKQQVARMLIFYLTDSIYVKPIMLLPPHIRELLDFSSKIITFPKFYTYGMYQRLLSRISKNAFISNSPEIALLINPNIPPSWQKCRYFLKNFVNPTSDNILNEVYRSRLTELFVSINESIRNGENSELELLVENARTQESNTYQCRRDAGAIRYVIELNKYLSDSNIAVFYVSSANWQKNLKETGSFKMAIEIKGINFKIIRDLDYFSTFLLEIEKLAEYQEKDFKINISDLKSIVSSDLANYRCQRKNKDFEVIPFF